MKHKLYYHTKSGGTYRLIGAGNMEADMSAVAIYTDHPNNERLWVRPHLEFFDGRFQQMGEWDDGGFDPLGDIAAFHTKFDLDANHPMGALDTEVADFRRKFLREEAEEWDWAQKAAFQETTRPILDRDEAEYTHQLEKALDGLVDLAYVLFGTVYLHGFHEQFAEAWRRVHAANMQKERAELDGSNSKRGSSFDVVKPAGWEPSVLTDLVECNDIHHSHSDRA